MVFYTPPLAIVDAPARADHFTRGRAAPIAAIVIHATAGRNSLDWLTFSSPPGKEVSIHRLVAKSGRIYKIVGDADTAWHAGPGQAWQAIGNAQFNLNSVSLGLELENLDIAGDRYTTAQLGAAALQIVEWWGLYGFLPLLRHFEVQDNKKDPQFLPWVEFQTRIAEALRAVL